MDSVLTTIAADQDAIIRADARRPLIVDGGPGTGKTVVALHRAAYLLYTDPRLRDRRAACCSSAPTIPTCTMSPMCCPAWARRMCAPAPSSTWRAGRAAWRERE